MDWIVKELDHLRQKVIELQEENKRLKERLGDDEVTELFETIDKNQIEMEM